MENEKQTVGKTTTESVGVTETQKAEIKNINQWIDSFNPYKMSDAQMEKASQITMVLYEKDKELLGKASEVVRQLNLAGLWRGYEASVLIVAKAIKGGRIKW